VCGFQPCRLPIKRFGELIRTGGLDGFGESATGRGDLAWLVKLFGCADRTSPLWERNFLGLGLEAGKLVRCL
jgi:hypothetical protein